MSGSPPPAASPAPAATGIVLAGGASSRFAASDGSSKLDAALAGRSVLDWTIRAVAAACQHVVVAGRTGPSDASVSYVADPAPGGQGPLAGLRAGLATAGGELVVVAGGDMPLLSAPVLRLLVDRLAANPDATAAAVRDGDVLRPLPLALRREPALEAIGQVAAAGQRALRDVVAALSVVIVEEAEWRPLDPGGQWRFDIDRREDLAEAARRLASSE
ncbi:MAG TPA: molybdenum cofactor guanylyltransferase [Candidatus Limnocylindrales bacterium]